MSGNIYTPDTHISFPIGIKLGPLYQERLGNYRYFLGVFIGPFLEKYGYNPNDPIWDTGFLPFQSFLLNNMHCQELSSYLHENGFEVKAIKKIYAKIKLVGGQDVLHVISESGSDIAFEDLLAHVQKKELVFGFFPEENGRIGVIFSSLHQPPEKKEISIQEDINTILQDIKNPESILHSLDI